MSRLYEHFIDGFQRAVTSRGFSERRIGAELKFPLVNRDGTAAALDELLALWHHLAENGWESIQDAVTGQIAGATRPGAYNDTVASCETGYCKTEFSLAHVASLFELSESIDVLRGELESFAKQRDARFLGYGIQPVTPPGRNLLFKKARSCFWDQAMPSNRRIPPERGDDMHLFTVNAGSHVHVSIDPEDAAKAVNVLNGFAGPQIALAAHSAIWQGRRDEQYLCVNEKLWDWWKPAEGRSGMPQRPFENLEDYVRSIENLAPIFVKREGKPILLGGFDTFGEYFASAEATGRSLEGEQVRLVPQLEDIGLHNSCYWYTARISQYFTVENRVFDQQPPDQLELPAALTLGLVSALDAAWEELARYSWAALREAREAACRDGLEGRTAEFEMAELASRMLEVAAFGLKQRGLGEEKYLEPLRERLGQRTCPARDAIAIFEDVGASGLVEQFAL
ncbi:MAG: glutamate-cysteine ligase family protein [Planctomycetota bacterium]